MISFVIWLFCVSVVLIPLFAIMWKRKLDLLDLEINEKEFDLTKRIVVEAVCYANQVTDDDDEPESKNKNKNFAAVAMANNTAIVLAISDKHKSLISPLIESTLWEIKEDDDDDDDEF